MKCNLCPNNCGALRTECENIGGICKMPLNPKVAKADLHFWEEPCISGTNGSGTVFFSGCALNCVFCQNYDISQNGFGKVITPERLAEIFKELVEKGAHNINLVNPTHYCLAIKKALEIYRPPVPVVYNSGGYDKVTTLEILKDYIDIYLLDLKYMSPERALKYSGRQDYPEIAVKAIKFALKQKHECVIKNGIMKSGVIIRHLLLPQGTNDAINAFNFVNDNAKGAYFSLMAQYVPFYKAKEDKIINRPITKREYEKVLNVIIESGFKNVYSQEFKSSSEEFIPQFDLSGV